MIYRLRYRALEAGTAPRNAAACVALLLASYVMAGLINASTVTQPALTAPRSQTVIVTPTAVPAADDLIPSEIPEPESNPDLIVEAPAATQTL